MARWIAANWKRPLERVCFYAYRKPVPGVANIDRVLELYVVTEEAAEQILTGARYERDADLFGRNVPLHTLAELLTLRP